MRCDKYGTRISWFNFSFPSVVVVVVVVVVGLSHILTWLTYGVPSGNNPNRHRDSTREILPSKHTTAS
jgi:hypothetical protein